MAPVSGVPEISEPNPNIVTPLTDFRHEAKPELEGLNAMGLGNGHKSFQIPQKEAAGKQVLQVWP